MAKKAKKGPGFWKEFKEFINRGNAFMLAVGVVIGGAFSAIVNAFVNILLTFCIIIKLCNVFQTFQMQIYPIVLYRQDVQS